MFKHRDYLKQFLNLRKSLFVYTLSVACFISIDSDPVILAQVVPDDTLPSNTLVLPDGSIKEIIGGTTVGNNLFHSFKQFSLSTGDTAWFNNDLTIENLIGRVTGGSISHIDGLIRANGTANLFLINPNGIIFGENAALDIGGSFLGSTANSLKFADGSEFSAIDPQAPPLLTVNIPLGLQYGINNGDIVVQGTGNQLQFNPNFTVNRESRPTGLQVDAGQTLALIGGNVFLDQANLTTEAGNIEIGSVIGEGFVQLNPTNLGWNLDYSGVSNFQDIHLTNASSLEVSGNGGGNVHLQGRQVIITDGSAILADNIGERNGGKLEVNASELLVVAGTAAELPFISRLSTDVAPIATGNGGDIELNAGTLIIADGAQVISSTYGNGDTGNIQVRADDVELISGSPIAFSSGLFTLVFGSGNGGDVDIEANDIFVLDGAEAAALTFGDGAGGNLNITANNTQILGTSRGGTSSSLSTNTEGIGDGGNLTIETESLLVAEGGLVQSSVFNSGNGGNINIRTTEIELSGGAPGVGSSGIFANVESGATGNGGKLTIETESLLIADGAQALVATFGDGNGGILEIDADKINLIGTSPNGLPSGLFSNVEGIAKGNGGEINITTQKLQIDEGAQISALTNGEGLGGSIQVKAEEIELIGISSSSPSGLFTVVRSQARGNGGSLNIDTNSLQIKNGAQVAVGTAGIGNGGELQITANEIELTGGSEFGASGIFGNAIIGMGDGGNLNINANNLTILEGATISASNFSSRGTTVEPGQGKAGNINISANFLNLDRTTSLIPSTITASTNNGGGGQIAINVGDGITLNHGSQITAETLGNGDGGNIAITTNNFNLNNQAEVSANSAGLGQAGDIKITAQNEITTNKGKITATSTESGGGNINLATDSLFLANNSLVSTSVLDSSGGGGNLTIDSNYLIAQDNSDLRANAVLGQGGNIDITTEVILLSLDSEVDASSQFGLDGVVEIKTPETEEQIGVVRFSEEVQDPNALISTICPVELDNVMVNTGKGGLAENPSQNLRSQSVWDDLRDFSSENEVVANNSIHQPKPQNKTIIEAQGWIVDSTGNIELISHLSFNQCRSNSDRN